MKAGEERVRKSAMRPSGRTASLFGLRATNDT
jgi:hypothetical protein